MQIVTKSKKLKLLVASSLYYPYVRSGAEKSTRIIVNALKRQFTDRLDIKVITTAPKDEHKIVDNIHVYYTKPINISTVYNYNKGASVLQKLIYHPLDTANYLFGFKINNIIDKVNPDILWTNNLGGFSVVLWQKAHQKKIKVVHTIRDYYLLCIKRTLFSNGKICKNICPKCKIPYYIKRYFANHYVDGVVGISNMTLSIHQHYGIFTKTPHSKIIHNPANLTHLNSRQVRIKNNYIRFGWAGTINEQKGLDHVIKAFNQLKLTNYEFNIWGRYQIKSYYNNLMKLADKNERIHFKGYTSNIDDIYNSSDVMIISSVWYEPLSRIILESLARGIPVITTDLDSFKEIMKPKINGLTYKTGNSNSLAKLLTHILKNPNIIEKLSKNARKDLHKFNDEVVARSYYNFFNELL